MKHLFGTPWGALSTVLLLIGVVLALLHVLERPVVGLVGVNAVILGGVALSVIDRLLQRRRD